MLTVGVTGQSGFIGNHLYNLLGLFPDEFERIDFEKIFFKDQNKLNDFVSRCDVIVHLAALNRHNEPQVIYETNTQLVEKLIASLKATKSKAHVIFSSSTQEEKDNVYGKSKKKGRELLVEWAKNSGGRLTGLIIPNVFGPFGHPFYNSVVATFCHQLSHNEIPKIEVDSNLKLIYVGELVSEILEIIRQQKVNDQLHIQFTSECKVSEILSLLQNFKQEYQDKGVIPLLIDRFQLNLFNTYRCYMDIAEYFPVKLNKHTDERGVFVEIIRLNARGQISFSTTAMNVTRGNHFHTRKIERFAVIKGNALIQLRRVGTNKVLDFVVDGNEPAYVDMPIWYTHNIKNIGEEELYTIFWINEFYDPNDADTYFEVV